jgi:hypothetical protein
MRRGSAATGLLVLLVGLAMIGLAFWLAYQMFLVPPSQALKLVPGEVIDLGATATSLIQVVVKVVMLVLMAGFGSLFANRGIKLYEASLAARAARSHRPEDPDQR